MGQLRILNASGDTTLTWDPAKQDEVDAVKAEFDRIIARNYVMAYAPVAEKPGQHVQVREFDPTASEIVVRGAIVGG